MKRPSFVSRLQERSRRQKLYDRLGAAVRAGRHTLYRTRLARWKDLARAFCLWYFLTWRGYSLDAPASEMRQMTEADQIVFSLLLWANAEYLPVSWAPRLMRQAVRWT